MKSKPYIYTASGEVRPKDIRALANFINSAESPSERAFQKLLQKHPSLIGVLGFSEFCTEFPLFKRDNQNHIIFQDKRKRDRADILAARMSEIDYSSAYRSTHIIELKAAVHRITTRSSGHRLSDQTNQAINQLKDYKSWVTTIPENRTQIAQLGWDIRTPMLYLIMGQDREFQDNPGRLAEIKAILIEQGIQLFTTDEILRRANQFILQQPIIIEQLQFSKAKRMFGIFTSSLTGMTSDLAIKIFNDCRKEIRNHFFKAIGLQNPAPTIEGEALRTMVLLGRYFPEVRQQLFKLAWEYAKDIVVSDGDYWIPDEYHFLALIGGDDVLDFFERSIRTGLVSHVGQATEVLCSMQGERALKILENNLARPLKGWRENSRFLETIAKYKGLDFLYKYGKKDIIVSKYSKNSTTEVERLKNLMSLPPPIM